MLAENAFTAALELVPGNAEILDHLQRAARMRRGAVAFGMSNGDTMPITAGKRGQEPAELIHPTVQDNIVLLSDSVAVLLFSRLFVFPVGPCAGHWCQLGGQFTSRACP